MPRTINHPIVLYSAITWLAYKISEAYYGGQHFVWCTPHFDPSSTPSLDYAVPPSSSPAGIYRMLRDDVKRGDHHSAKIAGNKAGLLRAIERRRTAGQITDRQACEIASIIEAAETRDFKPLIFVIPFHLVAN